MKRRVMRQEDVAEFCRYLQGEERSQGTIETYRREIRAFAATLPENRVVTKEVVVAWKRDPGKAVRGEHGQRETGGTQRPIFLPGMAGVPGEASAAAAGIVPG